MSDRWRAASHSICDDCGGWRPHRRIGPRSAGQQKTSRYGGIQEDAFRVQTIINVPQSRPFYGAVYKEVNGTAVQTDKVRALQTNTVITFKRPVLSWKEKLSEFGRSITGTASASYDPLGRVGTGINRWFVISQMPQTDLLPQLSKAHLQCLARRGRLLSIGSDAFMVSALESEWLKRQNGPRLFQLLFAAKSYSPSDSPPTCIYDMYVDPVFRQDGLLLAGHGGTFKLMSPPSARQSLDQTRTRIQQRTNMQCRNPNTTNAAEPPCPG